MLAKRLIKSNDAGGGACTNTVDLYNPFPDGGGVALYQLNGDATDVSGNYNGTVSGGTFENNGVFGQCWDTTGTADEYITATQPPNVKTVSAWVNVTGTHTNSVGAIVWSNGAPSAPSVSYFLGINVNGSIYAFGSHLNGLTRTINLNQWYHVAATLEGTTVKIYFDGALVETRTTAFPEIVNGTQITMGRSNYAGNLHNLHGSIDQVRLFTRALRPYEVEALYTEEYCTPTIVPSEHFNTALYTGNGGTNAVTGVGFAPDLVWAKGRSVAYNQWVYDTVRGANAGLLPNLTNSENTTPGVLSSLDSDGFTLGSNGELNQNNATYVSWNFKAGGAAVTNTDGTITSQVSANVDAGFSVVKYVGNGVNGATIGHGLGTTPSVSIVKNLNAGTNWDVAFNGLSGGTSLNLDTTTGVFSPTLGYQELGENVITLKNGGSGITRVNTTQNYIAYVFAQKEGFSNFGSYVGSAPTRQGIVTGFEPAFVMIKRTDTAKDWQIFDNKRFSNNRYDAYLAPNTSAAEAYMPDLSNYTVEFLENGFSVQDGSFVNGSGGTYIYMAFAADPTTIEPTLEDSFNTVLYTGNGSTGSRSITGVGFQPDFVWTKQISAGFHGLHTSVQGKPYQFTNLTAAEQADAWYNNYGWVDSYDSDGFTLIGGNDVNNGTINASGIDYVAWNWKGAELPAINSNGSIPSVVSANPAAGFSIVSYTNTTSGTTDQRYTIGHGLDSAPDLIITKVRNVDGYRWTTYNSFNGTGQYMALNETRASTAFARAFPVTPSSTVFTLDEKWPHPVNGSAIAYCFHSVAGFSKFGNYDGTGSVGNKQTMDFEPAFVLIKPYNVTGSWVIFDNKRNTSDPRTKFIRTNTSDAESTSTGLDFYTNGFDFNGSNLNVSGYSYIYMAFANQF